MRGRSARAHAVAVADLNGDGASDVVAGPRRRAVAAGQQRRAGQTGRSACGSRASRATAAGWARRSNCAPAACGRGSRTSAATPAVAPADLVFGLGPREGADVVRVLWPSGILQAETAADAPADAAGSEPGGAPAPADAAQAPPVLPSPLAVQELDRKPSSCPILFTWDGEKFTFVTDFLGGGEMGYWHGPGIYNTPDPVEYIRIRGDQLRPRDGLLRAAGDERARGGAVRRPGRAAGAGASGRRRGPSQRGDAGHAQAVPPPRGARRPAAGPRRRPRRPGRDRSHRPPRRALRRGAPAGPVPRLREGARPDARSRPDRRPGHAAADRVDRLRVLERQRGRLPGGPGPHDARPSRCARPAAAGARPQSTSASPSGGRRRSRSTLAASCARASTRYGSRRPSGSIGTASRLRTASPRRRRACGRRASGRGAPISATAASRPRCMAATPRR